MSKLELKHYDWDKKETVIDGEVDIYQVSKAFEKGEQVAELLSGFLNSFSQDFRSGFSVGRLFQNQHRTLQGTLYRWALGLIVGLGDKVEIRFTDARNETAIKGSQQIAKMIENDELMLGYLI